LVPGFGVIDETPPAPGFGTLGEFFQVAITAEDRKEAEDVIKRYDRDGDGILNSEEIKRGRWYSEPMTYDQNKDGSLSSYELAVRYARRRVSKSESKSSSSRKKDDRRRRRDDDDDDDKDEEKRTSWRFATAHERLPDGLPSWFREKDKDLDGQVAMHEYATEWNDETAAEFLELDVNTDGILSPYEANGSVARAESSTDGSAKPKTEPSRSAAKAGATGRPSASTGSQKAIPDKFMNWAASTIKRYDENKDGYLSTTEMKKMRRPPKNADANRDGRVSAAEYARSVMPK
jgi:hypothetical protein